MIRVLSCLHPKIVVNPYTGEKISTPCGKCDVCINNRAALWVTRLDMESASHKYTLFCTLTYDDDNVPQLVRYDDEEKPHMYLDPETGETFDLYDIKETFEKKDWRFFHETKYLNVLSSRDIQLFIKRLRARIYEINKTYTIRYYITGELGPRTYRPHWHALFFFDSEILCSQIATLLSETWSYGVVYKPHLVSGSAASYCASYINSLASLPKIYHHRKLRPRSLFSKSPAIGTMYPLLSSDAELFRRGDNKFTLLRPDDDEFTSFPLLRSIESRLYPRCQRFGSLLSSDRVSLYRLAENFQNCETCEEIANRIECEYIKSGRSDFFGRYFQEITKKYCFKWHFLPKEVELPWTLKDMPFLPKDIFISGNMEAVKVRSYEYCPDSLVRFARCIMRVLHQSQAFSVSIEEYVHKIESYYNRKDKERIVSFYDYLDEYFKTHPVWHMVYFDFSFYKYVTSFDSNCWSKETIATLSDWFDGEIPLCSHDDVTVLDIPPLESLPDYQSMRILYSKISHDKTKQKYNNDYALSRSKLFYNVIHYQNS